MDRVSDVLKGKAGTLLTIASDASVYDMVSRWSTRTSVHCS